MDDNNTMENQMEAQEKLTETPAQETHSAEVQAQLKEMARSMADELIAPMKENMNAMAKARDEALKKNIEMEESVKAAKLAKLESEGKTSEALQMKLDEAMARVQAQEQTIVKFSRDSVVDTVMQDFQFKNGTAKEMAKIKILDELKQDEDGSWVHATGASVNDFVASFAKNEENSFLFKPKTSSGSPSMQQGTAADIAAPTKPVTEMTSAEMLQAAATGAFGAPQGLGF